MITPSVYSSCKVLGELLERVLQTPGAWWDQSLSSCSFNLGHFTAII